jgi:YVTN family beta-propeller protein
MKRLKTLALLIAAPLGAWAPPPASPVTITSTNAADYTHVLPDGRQLSPVGTIAVTPNFPTAVVRVGNQIAVLANGATPSQSVTLYDANTLAQTGSVIAYQKTPKAKDAPAGLVVSHQSFFQGLTAGPDGMLYAAGGASNDVLAISTQSGTPQLVRTYALTWQPFPATQYPYVYQGLRDKIRQPVPDAKTPVSDRYYFPDAVVLQGQNLFVTGMLSNSLARIDVKSGEVRYLNVGAYPNAMAFADHGRVLVVALWGENAVALVDPQTMKLIGTVETGPKLNETSTAAGMHPIALATDGDSSRVYVALANADEVAEIDTTTRQVVRRISMLPYAGAAPGSFPDGLALAGDRLYVTNAGDNDIAVIDTKTGKQRGLIPTGWYPTAAMAEGDSLYTVSAKGLGSGPNLKHQWDGTMMQGLLQKVALATQPGDLAAMTAATLGDDEFLATQRSALAARNAALTPALQSKIQTVVLILRENKTFDESFGTYPGLGSLADPQFSLYDGQELPNLYAAAKGGALFADYDEDGEVTAQGHQWTTAASSSDFVERTWGQYYSDRVLQSNPGWTQSLSTPGPNEDPNAPYLTAASLKAIKGPATNPWISYPYGMFLFDNLARHGVPFENFGEFIARDRAGDVQPELAAQTDAGFPGWDTMLLDTDRAKVVDSWIAAHSNAMPRFIYIWLPDDHTAGRSPGFYTPDSYVANNDAGTGQIIAALSHTAAWKHMVVFVTEDDAQSGADHVDAHRSFLVAYGPWVKPGSVVTQHYSQIDMMRTIETILGVPPMSRWDQNADIIDGVWASTPADAPFTALPMQIPMSVNPGNADLATTLEREAGQKGQLLTPAFVAAHSHETVQQKAPSSPAINGAQSELSAPYVPYTPVSMMKVTGTEQMRQEWVASKGPQGYAQMMAALDAYAAKQGAPASAFTGGTD